MKNTFLKYFLLSISFTIITEITNEIINLKDLLNHFLSNFLSTDQVNSYFEFQDQWHWLTYLYIPLIILFKTSIIATVLYIGLFLVNREAKYNSIWNIVLEAEFIFLLVPIFKTLWFLFFQTNYDLNDVQNFYPLSALNITGYRNLDVWFIYPFQVLNLFEFFYIIYISFQIGKLTNTNADYGLKIVGISYVPVLLLWVTTVMFFTLNYS
ncbi:MULTISPECIES: hypothetical protein [Flavobacterium]|uniref:hypothetical protein n=1 Tax=Flavobacterium TaxID=237 RepID=UPI0021151659|nr:MULTISPECIES: hypothetical protein [Flavobacterium]UUF15095.1 hypothetical protein NLJ00_03085 [Flavobacterium panici]